MHSDQSARHIALTCPHCGKHYKKVPYDAIKRHQFAFCKQCTTKFRVEPSVLEEALKQAGFALAAQSLEVPDALSQQREHATSLAGEHESVSDQTAQIQDMQTMPGLQDIVKQAAEEARGFVQEPLAGGEPYDSGLFLKLFPTQQIEAEEQPGIEGFFEQKINKLAASIDETFGQPQESSQALETGDITAGNIFNEPLIDTTQAEHVPEAYGDHRELSSAPSIQELDGLHIAEPIEYQTDATSAEETSAQDAFDVSLSLIPGQAVKAPLEIDTKREAFEEPQIGEELSAASAEPAFEEETFEDAFIEDEAIDVSLEIDARRDAFEEPLLDEQFSAASAESPFDEETLEDILIEDQSSEQFEQDKAYAIEAQKKGSGAAQASELKNLAHKGFLASQGATGANRDVSDMLRDLVLPTAEMRDGMEQFVLFSLGEHLFAALVANVFELSLPPDVIMVPNTPQWMLGIANMRGEIISIVDLMGFLGKDQENIKRTSRMIIAQTKDRQLMVGLVVDSINGIKYFPTDEILSLQQKASGQAAAYLNGAFAHEDTTVAILDFEKLLQSPKMRQFQ